MNTIGIKLADGSFYPVMEEGQAQQKTLDLTTAHNNQTKVMVDLYRSASCSMDDAEYVDSLQIENLNARPTGEADITFKVALDDDNKLSANIVDTETGKQSNTQITLVSRTLEERLVTDEYQISENKSGIVAPKKRSAGGLLARANAIKKETEEAKAEDATLPNTENAQSTDETVVQEESEPVTEETAVNIEENSSDSDFNLGDPEVAENFVDDFSANDETQSDTETSEDNENQQTDAWDFATDEAKTSDTEINLDDDNQPSSDDFSIDESALNFDDEISDSNNLVSGDETSIDNDEIQSDDKSVAEEIPPFDFETFENDSGKSTNDEEIPEDNENQQTDAWDFATDEAKTSDTEINLDDNNQTSNDDFSDNFAEDDKSVAEEIPPFDFETFENDSGKSTNDDIFSESNGFSANAQDNSDNDYIANEKPISFTGLYDKETELGESAADEEEKERKKTKVPVIICIICAIICVIATVLILFIVPSKYNLLSKKSSSENEQEYTAENSENSSLAQEVESPAENTLIIQEVPVETKSEVVEEKVEEPPVPAAKEDEIVIIEKAEEVVPEQPAPAKTEPQKIYYKIRWGDTLWDIADTYYKNPWRYKYIAKYNGIKNPDYIISGNVITIPAE